MKCLQKEPSRRYASARELEGDLRRYLAGEPIQARPVGKVEWLMKWTRRRPAVAALLAGLVLTVAVTLVGTVVALVFISDAWEKEATARQIADNEKILARKQKEEARYNEYVAEMNLAQREYEAGNLGSIRKLLAAQVPREANTTDWRNFEWYYWQRMAHREILVLEGHADWVYRVDTSRDGRWLASASRDQTIRIWEAATRQHLLTLRGHTGPVSGVRFSPDGRRLASASADGTVRLWDSSTGETLHTLKGHTKAVYSVSFSPDGRRLASTSEDETARLWDPASGQELLTLKGNAGICSDVAFGPDGRRLATASGDQTVRVWDSATGEEQLILRGHTNKVLGVSFSPDGSRLASASEDHTVRLWDSTTGKEVLTLKGHTNEVRGVSFSPDGSRLASAAFDRTVRVWETQPVSAAVWRQRALLRQVTALFDELLLREEVLTALYQDPTLDEDELNVTVQAAESYDEVHPGVWNATAWYVVRERNRAKQAYARALYYAECADHRNPQDGLILNTVGVSQYRLGRYADALATLRRSEKLNTADKGSHPDDIAFQAMAQHQLGNKNEARALLGRLRQLIKLPRWSHYPEAASFLQEAEELIEGKPSKSTREDLQEERGIK